MNQVFNVSGYSLMLSTSQKHYAGNIELASEPTLTILAFTSPEGAKSAKASIEASKVPGLIVTALFKE